MGYTNISNYSFMDFGSFATADAVAFGTTVTVTLAGNDYDYETEAADAGWDTVCDAAAPNALADCTKFGAEVAEENPFDGYGI